MGILRCLAGALLSACVSLTLAHSQTPPALPLTYYPHAQALLENAQGLWDRNEDVEALRLFEALVRDFPDTQQATMAMAKIGLWWREHGDARQAFAWWNRVLREFPGSIGNAEVWALIASAAEKNQQYGKALVYWRKVIRAFPGLWQEARARSGRARIRWRVQQDYRRAIADYQRVLACAPNAPMAAEAQLFLGHNCLWLGETQNALLWYDRVLKGNPEPGVGEQARYYRGYCRATTGTGSDPRGAIEDLSLTAATAADPELRVRALGIMANCYEGLGGYEEARMCLRAVLADCSPEFALFHPSTMHFMAHTYFCEGRYREAAEWLEDLLAQYPDDVVIPHARELLQQVRARAGAQ